MAGKTAYTSICTDPFPRTHTYGHSGSVDSKLKLLSSSYKGTGEKELPCNWSEMLPLVETRNNPHSFCIEKLSTDNITWVVHRHNLEKFFRKKRANFGANRVS